MLKDYCEGEVCVICETPAKHKTHDKYHRRAFLCCEHYQMIFGKNPKYCEHEPEQSEQLGEPIIINKTCGNYNVRVILNPVPFEDAMHKWQQIQKVLEK